MAQLNLQTQQQIIDLLNACTSYWELRGISQSRSDEMRIELEQHLQQAISDGKSLEAVVGTNPPAFAEAWAREMGPQLLRIGFIPFHVLIYALCVLSSTALLAHFIQQSAHFHFTLFYPFAFISIVLTILIIQWVGFFSPRFQTRMSREWLMIAFLMISILPLIAIARFWNLRVSMVLLTWEWPLTVILFVIAIILFGLSLWLFPVKRSWLNWDVTALQTLEQTRTVRYVAMYMMTVLFYDVIFLLII